jgi:hypothetical protein
MHLLVYFHKMKLVEVIIWLFFVGRRKLRSSGQDNAFPFHIQISKLSALNRNPAY